MASDLKITMSREPDRLIVKLSGEARMDFDAADEHIRAVLAHRLKQVIVDAKELAFISSVGMSFLLNMMRSVQRSGGTMKLRSLQPQVRKVLQNARVLHLFEVVTEEGEPAP
jgi:anti-anti-sigma factor